MAQPISYQDWAAWLRKKYPKMFGGITNDRSLVEEAMVTWPETNYRDMFGDANYADLKELQPGGGAGQRAGVLKQLGFNTSTMGLNMLPLPEAYAAAKLNPIDEKQRFHDNTMKELEEASKLGMNLSEYQKQKKDAKGPESWPDWYMRQMKTVSNAVPNIVKPAPFSTMENVWSGLRQIPGLADRAAVDAEKTRRFKDKIIDDWVARDPELQGHLLNVEENPITLKNIAESENKMEMLGRGVATALPSMAAFLLASRFGGPKAGMGVAFGLGKGAAYDETMSYLVDEMGMEPKDAVSTADQISTAVGVGEMVLETLGGSQVAKALGMKKGAAQWSNRFLRDKFLKSFKDGTVRSWGVDAIKSTIMESVTEMSQEMNSFLGIEAVKQGYGSSGDDAIANLIKEYSKFAGSSDRRREVFEKARAEEAAIIGGGMGFGGGLPGGARTGARAAWNRFKKKKGNLQKKAQALYDEVPKEDTTVGKVPRITVEDDPILLKRLINPDKMTAEERERGDELYGAWGFRDKGTALDWILSLISDRNPKAVTDAGFTYDDIRAGIRSQFPAGVPGYESKMKAIDNVLKQIEDGERVIPETQTATPLKTGISLEEKEKIEQAKRERKKVEKEDVSELFPERDITEPAVEPTEEPDAEPSDEPVDEPQEFMEEEYQDPEDMMGIVERDQEIIEKFEELDETPKKDPKKHLEEAKEEPPLDDTYDYDAYTEEFTDVLSEEEIQKQVDASRKADDAASGESILAQLESGEDPEPDHIEDIGQEAEVDFSKVDLGTEAPAEDTDLQTRMTKGIEEAASPTAKKWVPKEQVKTKIATQFIGEGSPKSSTDRYEKMYTEAGVANTNSYTADDIIYVSSNGKRTGRVDPVVDGELQGAYRFIDTAIEAGASFIMDTADHLSKTKGYNVGEMQLAQYISDHGYSRQGTSGLWKPTEPAKKESKVEGINIYTQSDSKLGRALTNPTWGSDKDGARYYDVEAEYQKRKTGDTVQDKGIMKELIVEKFKRSPELVKEITDRGGEAFLKASSHSISPSYDAKSRWTGKGEESEFIAVLVEAYNEVTKPGDAVIGAAIKALADADDPVVRDTKEEYKELDRKLTKEGDESPIFGARAKDLNFTSDQVQVLNHASKTTGVSPSNEGAQAVYSGYAGTGKTTIVENIATDARNNGYKVKIGAPTNKAVRRLEEVIKGDNPQFHGAEFTTMHSLLYEGMDKQTRVWKPNSDLGPNDLIIIDESSMISQELYDEIKKNAIGAGAKVIFLGDSFQLKPVGKDPLILSVPDVLLTQVRRQALDSEILKFATSLRLSNPNHLTGKAKNIFLPPVGKKGDVMVVNDATNRFLADLKAGGNVVYITHSNNKRVDTNYRARTVKYGAKADKEPVLPGDQIIYVGNAKYLNGETGVVSDKVEILGKSTVELEWWNHKKKAYQIDKVPAVFYQDGKDKVLLIPGLKISGFRHTDIKSGIPTALQSVDEDSGQPTGDLPMTYNLATHGYAITAHKSQGSEWETVYVDYDTAGSSDFSKRISNDPRWIYTAATRARKNLIIQDIPSLPHATWEQMDKLVESKAVDKMPGIDNQADVNEALQGIAVGQRISQDLDLFRTIQDKLSKVHPYITVELLEKVFSKHGVEVAGKAIDKAVQISMSKGNLNTLPHEYMEVYLDLMQDDKFVMDAIKRQKADSFSEAKHQLAMHTQDYLVGRMTDKSLKKRTELFLRRFWKQFKALFTTLNDTELYDLIAERFYRGKGADTAAQRASSGVEALQPILTTLGMTRLFAYYDEMWSRAKRAAARVKVVDKWKSVPDINDFIKQVQTMLIKADASGVHSQALIDWVDSRFPDNKFYEWTRASNDPLPEPRLFISANELQHATEGQFDEVVEGLVSKELGPDDFDLRSADFKLENRAIRELGLTLSTTEANDLFYKSRDAIDFGDFMTYVKENFLPFPSDKDVMWVQRYYISRRSTIEVNRDDRIGNRRTNLLLDLGAKKLSVIQSTDPTRFDRKNLQWDKTNLLERVNNTELVWLSGEEVYVKKAPDWYQETYGFITEEDLSDMETDMQSHKLVPVFTRGEKPQLAFVEWNNEHEKKAANAKEYWAEEVREGKLTFKQSLNFMGAGMETEEITNAFLAGEIARFEAYEDMYPGLIKSGDGATLLKRAKIPTTPVTIVEEVKDMIGFTFNPTNVSFLNTSNGHVQPAMIQVEGHQGLKYIYDGASLTSSNFFGEYITHGGVEPGTEHLKTVVYSNNADGHIAIKHQHFMRKSIEVWDNYGEDNARLIATVDGEGNIISGAGQAIDILNTNDESKISSFEHETPITLSSSSIGLIKYASVHQTGKHPMQWYNYIRDAHVRDAFKKHYVPRIKNNLKEIFKLVRGGTEIVDGEEVRKEAWEYVYDLVQKLDGNMPDFITHTLVEKARLRAGTHTDMTDLLNVIVKTKMIEPALQIEDVEGSILEFTPNTDGRVDEGEMALPYKNAQHIIQRYKDATGDKKKRPDIRQVNIWLKANEIYDLVYRSPIPYLGGAAMFKVKYLHESNNIVELHYNDLFGRFEGDNDGDTLHIEAIPPDLQDIFRALSDSNPLTTIDLDKYSKKKVIDISNRKNLYSLIGEMTYGGNAVSQIANIQNIYGQMQDSFSSIIMEDKNGIDQEIILRDPSSMSPHPMLKSETVTDMLRYFLQAALDNSKFLLLSDLEYTRNGLLQMLFSTKDGHPIEDNQFTNILPLINKYLNAPRLRNGGTHDESYNVTDSLLMSKTIQEFTQNRKSVYRDLYRDQVADNKVKPEGWKKGDPLVLKRGFRKVKDIFFKKGTSVIEDVTTTLAEVWDEEFQAHPDSYEGIDEYTMFKKSYSRHSGLHVAAMNKLNSRRDILKSMLEHDRDVNVPTALKAGDEYALGLIGEYFGSMGADKDGKALPSLVEELSNMGPNAWDKNEVAVKFADKWGKVFAELPYIAQVQASIRFLNAHRVASQFPPYGQEEKLLPLLHGDVMLAYNTFYGQASKEKTLNVTYNKKGEVVLEKQTGILADVYKSVDKSKNYGMIKKFLNMKKKDC